MKYFLTICFIGLHFLTSAQLYSLSASEHFVYFDTDSFRLAAKHENKIRNAINDIGGTNIKEIYVEGHTDSFATSDYNAALAQKRASSVEDYLLDMGIPSRVLKRESFGETKLVSEDHAMNRRARIYIVHETDAKNAMFPPKFIRVKCIDAKTKNPIKATIGFDYGSKDMRFSRTDANGLTPVLPILDESLLLVGEAPYYLSVYKPVSKEELEKPRDTLVYTLELKAVAIVKKFTFKNIYFYTDKDVIKPASEPELHKLLAILQLNKAAYVEIQGHMNFPINRRNNPLQSRYNRELSYKRAKAVYDYLVRAGIDKKRLTFKGMSNSRMLFPLPGSKSEEDANKRVEIYTLREK